MVEASWVSILPPVVAILLSIWTKQVVWSLFAGIWMGSTLLAGYQPIAGIGASLDTIIASTMAGMVDRHCGVHRIEYHAADCRIGLPPTI